MKTNKNLRAGIFFTCVGAICILIAVPLLLTGDLSSASARFPSLAQGAVIYAGLAIGVAMLLVGVFYLMKRRR
ncbi:hypothetical protein ACFM35_15945 [Microbacterium sp. P01]|uniref:hypothetical protein n=1 Tax=Microbacterium sp. P01 TaxID=3366261 RepID=UPI003671B2F6